MKLHVFNPEHDISLAQNNPNQTPSRAALQIRNDLDFIPYIWAAQGDVVLVNDVMKAYEGVEKLRLKDKNVSFIDADILEKYSDEIDAILPWGWDCAIKEHLKRLGISQTLLPSSKQLSEIRNLNNRKASINWLLFLKAHLPYATTVGEAYYYNNINDLCAKAKEIGKAVIKAPWSGSGRGLRFTDRNISTVHLNWAKNIITHQQGIILEPYYNKVQDFAMEFYIEGEVKYCGLSIFQSLHGAYTGSIIDTEERKRNFLSKYVDIELLDTIKLTLINLLECNIKYNYKGPLGIDMMIVEKRALSTSSLYAIHPFVEINFRRTMGHVALSLSNNFQIHNKMMRITYNGSHHTLELNDRTYPNI